jgi:hypothetical protein
VRRYLDYSVRLDVRRADSPDVIGSITTLSSAFANAPELDRTGRPQGLQVAIDAAIKRALHAFAPELVPAAPFPTLVEAPLRAEDNLPGGTLAGQDLLKSLETLYPELSADDLASLALSHARFLILKPGRLAALGLAPGDLVSGSGGQTLGSRGAFARALARGKTPALSIDRAGSRFLLRQTLVAQAR